MESIYPDIIIGKQRSTSYQQSDKLHSTGGVCPHTPQLGPLCLTLTLVLQQEETERRQKKDGRETNKTRRCGYTEGRCFLLYQMHLAQVMQPQTQGLSGRFRSRRFEAQVLIITLTMALFYSSAPISHDNMHNTRTMMLKQLHSIKRLLIYFFYTCVNSPC